MNGKAPISKAMSMQIQKDIRSTIVRSAHHDLSQFPELKPTICTVLIPSFDQAAYSLPLFIRESKCRLSEKARSRLCTLDVWNSQIRREINSADASDSQVKHEIEHHLLGFNPLFPKEYCSWFRYKPKLKGFY